MHFGEQNGNALFDLSGYIARGFNAHIWVSVPGIIGRNRLRLDKQEAQNPKCVEGNYQAQLRNKLSFAKEFYFHCR